MSREESDGSGPEKQRKLGIRGEEELLGEKRVKTVELSILKNKTKQNCMRAGLERIKQWVAK